MPRLQDNLLLTLRMAGIKRDWVGQGNTLTSQVGHYAKCCYHAESTPVDEKVFKVEARKALGDLTIQVMLSCAMLGIDFSELIMEGIASFREDMRFVTLRNKGEIKCPV